MNDKGTIQLPPAMSTVAADHDWLYYFVFWTSFAMFVAIVGLMIFFCIRFHHTRYPVAKPTEEHTKMELIWTFSPLILLVLLFHWGFQGYVKGAIAPDDAIQIRVYAEQWQWKFAYPNGSQELNNLRVPVDTPVKLIMSSKDVLHSFYVPEFRLKKDVVPGQYSTMWFRATRTGKAQVFCAEYCGTSHSGMLAKIDVVTKQEYDKFLKEGVGMPEGVTTQEDWGKFLYNQSACNTCHSLDGSPLVGPTWKGIWGRSETLTDGTSVTVDENYVRQSILEPNAKIVKGFEPKMPAYAGVLQDKQIDALIAFMKTLK